MDRAARCASFIETFCTVRAGRQAGQPVRLRPWQREILEVMFRPGTKRALIGLPRRAGKTSILSGVALYHLVADGERSPEIYGAATSREQARLVFREAQATIEASSALRHRLKVYRNEIVCPDTSGVYRVVAAEAHSLQGLSPSLALVDEGAMLGYGGADPRIWDALTLGTLARERPLSVMITTAGWDPESLAGRLYAAGKRGDDPDFGFVWHEAPDGAPYDDPATWRAANPALGDWIGEDDYRAALTSTPQAEFERFLLNRWTAAQSAWLADGAWSRVAGDPQPPPPATPIVLAFDGSFSGDSTAVVGATLGPAPRLFVVHHDEAPPGSRDDWRVDIAAAEQALRDACRRWDVREIACDPFRWQRTMQALTAEGLPIVEYPTTSAARMVAACSRFTDALAADALTHDDNPALARHIAAAVVKEDRIGRRIVKESRSSSRRIDLAVAAVVAYDRAAAQPQRTTFGVW